MTELRHKLLAGVLLLLASLCGGTAAYGQVVVLFDEASAVHKAFMEGLEAQLEDNGIGPSIALKMLPWRDGQASELVGADADRPALLVSVGSRITQQVIDARPAYAVLAALIPSATYAFLTQGISDGVPQVDAPQVSAVFLDQPVSRQIRLARAVKPGLSALGVVLSRSNADQQQRLTDAAQKLGMKLAVELAEDNEDASRAFRAVLAVSDTLIVTPDPLVLDPTNAKWLLYMAYQKRIPVIGFSEAYVKAGATAGVFSTPQQIGRETADRLAQWARGGWSAIRDPVAPNRFDVAINSSIAKSLGSQLPSADKLAEELRKHDGDDP